MTERNTINIKDIRFDRRDQMWDATVKHKDGSIFVMVSSKTLHGIFDELEEANVDVLNDDGSLYDNR